MGFGGEEKILCLVNISYSKPTKGKHFRIRPRDRGSKKTHCTEITPEKAFNDLFCQVFNNAKFPLNTVGRFETFRPKLQGPRRPGFGISGANE